MGRTLLPKFPRDQDERLWKYIRVLLLGASDDSDIDDPLLIRPPSLIAATSSHTIPTSSNVSLSSMTLNGGSPLGINGNSSMATAGVIGPRHINNRNTTLTLVPSSGKNKVIFKNDFDYSSSWGFTNFINFSFIFLIILHLLQSL